MRLDKISNGSQTGDSADANAFCDAAVLINALSRRRPESKMTAGRVTNYCDAAKVEVNSLSDDAPEVFNALNHVVKCARPSAIGVPSRRYSKFHTAKPRDTRSRAISSNWSRPNGMRQNPPCSRQIAGDGDWAGRYRSPSWPSSGPYRSVLIVALSVKRSRYGMIRLPTMQQVTR